MRSNTIIVGGLFLFLALMLSTLKPSGLNRENAVKHQGIVTEVYESDLKDLVVKLKGNATDFYMDVSAEGFTFEELKEKLLYKPVVIEYTERWRPLSESTKKQYISKLQYEDEIIFDED